VTAVTISGSYGSSTQSATLTVNPQPDADYTLSASPSSRTVRRGRTTTYGVSISWGAGLTGPVSLSVSGLPAGASSSFSTNPTSSTSTLSVRTNSRGTYQLTINGVRGSQTRTVNVTLVVT
jgi:serine protease AprX